MAYMVPLRFVRISDSVVVCATRIVTIMSIKSYQARNLKRAEKEAKTLINGCGTQRTETIIILDNGTVVSSPMSIRRIMTNLEKANIRQMRATSIYDTKKMRIYDVEDEEADPDVESEVYEVATDEFVEIDEDDIDPDTV